MEETEPPMANADMVGDQVFFISVRLVLRILSCRRLGVLVSTQKRGLRVLASHKPPAVHVCRPPKGGVLQVERALQTFLQEESGIRGLGASGGTAPTRAMSHAPIIHEVVFSVQASVETVCLVSSAT
mmetsp:Transcript_62411/g.165615  ORF Transcript_62411/g.165615 Transcript_62411/m.165615 type:complete len:127 (+) Transcript_62411:992-1372(+)